MDVCCLDTGYLQFSYSIIAASALYHMWGKDVTEITGNRLSKGDCSRPKVFLGKGALKICSKFRGEHPCRSVISVKLLLQLY